MESRRTCHVTREQWDSWLLWSLISSELPPMTTDATISRFSKSKFSLIVIHNCCFYKYTWFVNAFTHSGRDYEEKNCPIQKLFLKNKFSCSFLRQTTVRNSRLKHHKTDLTFGLCVGWRRNSQNERKYQGHCEICIVNPLCLPSEWRHSASCPTGGNSDGIKGTTSSTLHSSLLPADM